MKIAISGTHGSGKTTLVEELARALPTYDVIDEPYYLLEEEGHRFAEEPCPEDFELQLDRSIQCIVGSGGDVLFERCPIDFLAYLVANESMGLDASSWPARVRPAVEELDLVVFVPIEDPDRIRVPASESTGLRRRVDEHLRHFLLDDPWKLDVSVLEVTGTPQERARRVMAHLG